LIHEDKASPIVKTASKAEKVGYMTSFFCSPSFGRSASGGRIGTESGLPFFKLFYRFASKRSNYLTTRLMILNSGVLPLTPVKRITE